MAQRVLTGCSGCTKCNSAKLMRGTRNLARGIIAASTGGLSEVGMSFNATCGACGHQMSLHKQTGAQRLREEQNNMAQRRAETHTAYQEANHARVLDARAAALAAPTPISDDVRDINEMLARAKARANKSASPGTVVATEGLQSPDKVLPPPGFYTDPKPDPSQLRWWDGKEWTAFTKPKE